MKSATCLQLAATDSEESIKTNPGFAGFNWLYTIY